MLASSVVVFLPEYLNANILRGSFSGPIIIDFFEYFFFGIVTTIECCHTCHRYQAESEDRCLHSLVIKYELIKYEQIKYKLIKYEQIKYELIKYKLIKYKLIKYELIKYKLIKYKLIKYNYFILVN